MPKFIRPEFFDIFGVGIFSFIAVIAALALKTQSDIPRWALISLLIFGVLGLIIDSTIVYLTYIKKNK